MLFDWSSLPDEIKRIIFNYCKLDRKLQIKSELLKLKLSQKYKNMDSVINELEKIGFYQNQIRYTQNNGILLYTELCNTIRQSNTISTISGIIVGVDIDKNKIISNINNFCYNCKKNSSDLLLEPYEFVWYNPSKVVYKNNYNKIYVCYKCYFIIELLDGLCNMPQGTTIDNIIYDICFSEGCG